MAPVKNHILLPNGRSMPSLGLGTWQATDPAEIELTIHAALEAGYRHIDTAFNYGNEAAIGRVLRSWLESGRITREELFVVTKLPGNGMRPEHVAHFLRLSLAALQLDYVDLYLIHTPIGFVHNSDLDVIPVANGKVDLDKTTDLEAIWRAMELQVDAGLAKGVGLSNFTEEQIERVVKVGRIKPACVQVELHAYFQQKELRAFCGKLGIPICAYGALGSPGRAEFMPKLGLPAPSVPTILTDETVLRIAAAHKKTSGQILLRFPVQLGMAVIPKSTNPKRLKENLGVFDFELTPLETKELEALDKNERSFSLAAFPGADKHPEFPF